MVDLSAMGVLCVLRKIRVPFGTKLFLCLPQTPHQKTDFGITHLASDVPDFFTPPSPSLTPFGSPIHPRTTPDISPEDSTNGTKDWPYQQTPTLSLKDLLMAFSESHLQSSSLPSVHSFGLDSFRCSSPTSSEAPVSPSVTVTHARSVEAWGLWTKIEIDGSHPPVWVDMNTAAYI